CSWWRRTIWRTCASGRRPPTRRRPTGAPDAHRCRRKAVRGPGLSDGSDGDLAYASLPFARTGLVDRFAGGIDRYRDRHVADLELVDRFHAEVFEREHPRFANRLGDEVCRAADRHQVGGAMSANRLDRDRPALGLADHGDQAGAREHHLGELVHPGRRGRTGWPDRFVPYRIDRPNVVDGAVPEIDG